MYEERLLFEEETDIDAQGKPLDKKYLETGLPESLQKAIDDYVQADYLREKNLW